MERLYSREELAEILNIDPELIDFYLQRSESPIEKDFSYCRYDLDYFEDIVAEFGREREAS